MIAVGTYAIPAPSTPVAIAIRGDEVALGPGHAFAQHVTVSIHGTRVHFAPAQDLLFDGRAHGSRVTGTVRQGRLRGTFSLRRGASRIIELLRGLSRRRRPPRRTDCRLC